MVGQLGDRQMDRVLLVLEEVVKRYTLPAAVDAAREAVTETMIRSVVRDEIRRVLDALASEAL